MLVWNLLKSCILASTSIYTMGVFVSISTTLKKCMNDKWALSHIYTYIIPFEYDCRHAYCAINTHCNNSMSVFCADHLNINFTDNLCPTIGTVIVIMLSSIT
jgi:hypothetical protein